MSTTDDYLSSLLSSTTEAFESADSIRACVASFRAALRDSRDALQKIAKSYPKKPRTRKQRDLAALVARTLKRINATIEDRP